MGNCVSCREDTSTLPSHEIAARANNVGTPAQIDLLTSPIPVGISVMNSSVNGTYIAVGSELKKASSISGTSSGSRTPANSSIHHINTDCSGDVISTTITPSNSVKSQKSEKKNFYSRIPPLGRTGSTEKKAHMNNTSSSVAKDNNNQYAEGKICSMFEHYKDPHEDAVLAEGIERLCKDLELKPEDFKVLILAWKFHADQMCRFSREEFFDGMKELKVDSIPGIQSRLPDIALETSSDQTKFKDLYRFTFKFGLDTEIGQRVLPLEMAISLWNLVFSQNQPAILPTWIQFLESHTNVSGIPRDTWNMFLHFVYTVGNDLSSYDDTEAWPSLFDDFVEYEHDRLNENVISNNNTEDSDGDTNVILGNKPVNDQHFRYAATETFNRQEQ